MAVGGGDRHSALDAAVAERDGASTWRAGVGVGLEHRFEDAPIERARAARVGVRRPGVACGDVLAVDELGGDRDRRRRVEQFERQAQHRQMPVLQADEPLRDHPHLPAGAEVPGQLRVQYPGAEVDLTPEVRHLRPLGVVRRQAQHLVADRELDRLGLGRVEHRLAGAGKAERVLGVDDRERLVEAVDVGARRFRIGRPVGRAARGSRCRSRTGCRSGRRRRHRGWSPPAARRRSGTARGRS